MQSVWDEELIEEIDAVFFDGFGESSADEGPGDVAWRGITDMDDGHWYGREEYLSTGTSRTFRFRSEESAARWLAEIL